MKILVFTDMHASIGAVKKITANAKKHKPDLLICTGDFTIFGHATKPVLVDIDKIGIPCLLIHGNHETPSEIKKVVKDLKNITFLFEETHVINDTLFMAYGGGGFAFEEPDFEKLSKGFAKEMKSHKKSVLLLHQPPYNTKLDVLMTGEHCGNKTTQRFIKKHQPDYVFCGHLHETFKEQDTIGKTKLVNPGPFGMMFTI